VVTGNSDHRAVKGRFGRTPPDERDTAKKYRTPGRAGIQVRPYCLGPMMFGGIANPDHDDCIRIIHKAWVSASISSTPPTVLQR